MDGSYFKLNDRSVLFMTENVSFLPMCQGSTLPGTELGLAMKFGSLSTATVDQKIC